MQDPAIPLQTAVYAALTTPPVRLGEEVVPVFTQGASGPQYVLLSQWTAAPLALHPGCQQWDCTFLADVVTSFTVSGQVNELPALTIGAEIVNRFFGQRLPLPDGWQMGPALLTLAETLTDNSNKESVEVHRYLRFRMTLYT